MIYSLKPDERKKFIKQNLQKRQEDVSMFWDYYIGGGKQWKGNSGQLKQDGRVSQKGLFTRSGKRMYDINDKTMTAECHEDYVGRNTRIPVYEWGELNILDVVVDETAQTTRGFGKNKFQLEGITENATIDFNNFYQSIGGDVWLQDVTKNCMVYGVDAYEFSEEGDLVQIPRDECFTTDTVFYRSYKTDRNTIFCKEYTKDEIITYEDGMELQRVSHDFGMIPVIVFRNTNGVSEIARDIPVQDTINTVFTRILATAKDNMSPAVTVSDDSILEEARNASASQPFHWQRGAGTVAIMGSDGKMDYHTWDGLPNGTMDFLENIQKIYFNKKGIKIFDKTAIPESGEAKKEVRRNLYNRCQYLRDSMYNGFFTMARMFLMQSNYFETFSLDIQWADLVSISDKEKRELAMMDFTVHGNKIEYLIKVGYTLDEAEEIVNNAQPVLESII